MRVGTNPVHRRLVSSAVRARQTVRREDAELYAYLTEGVCPKGQDDLLMALALGRRAWGPTVDLMAGNGVLACRMMEALCPSVLALAQHPDYVRRFADMATGDNRPDMRYMDMGVTDGFTLGKLSQWLSQRGIRTAVANRCLHRLDVDSALPKTLHDSRVVWVVVDGALPSKGVKALTTLREMMEIFNPYYRCVYRMADTVILEAMI